MQFSDAVQRNTVLFILTSPGGHHVADITFPNHIITLLIVLQPVVRLRRSNNRSGSFELL